MPNHVTNRLSVYGPVSTVTAFRESAWLPREDGYVCDLSFSNLVPLPPVSYDTHANAEAATKIKINLWGVSASAYDIQPLVIDLGCVTYTFDTAWRPPLEFLRRVSERFPDLHFVHSYGGDGPIRGYSRWWNGLAIANVNDADAIVWNDGELIDETEAEQLDRQRRLVDYYLAHHWLEILRILSEMEYQTPASVLADWAEDSGYVQHAQQLRERINSCS